MLRSSINDSLPPHIILDVVNAGFIVHGPGQGHVAEVVDPEFLPGREPERLMGAAQPARDMTDGARPEMLVALGRSVAGAVGHADEGDIAGLGVLVPGTFEEDRNALPVPGLHVLFTGLYFVSDGHGAYSLRLRAFFDCMVK